LIELIVKFLINYKVSRRHTYF